MTKSRSLQNLLRFVDDQASVIDAQNQRLIDKISDQGATVILMFAMRNRFNNRVTAQVNITLTVKQVIKS